MFTTKILVTRICMLAATLIFSVTWLIVLVVYIRPNNEESNSHISFPSNLEELKQMSAVLRFYSIHHPLYCLVLFSSAYIFKQSFAIPGSVFLNLLGGATYGVWFGFPLCCLLTATGATCCYLISKFFGTELVEHFFERQLNKFREKVTAELKRSHLLFLLISLRLFPMSPNWFINIASPMVGVPIGKFFISVFIGLMPYNLICVQTGSLISDLNSLDDIFNLKTFLTLATISGSIFVPTLIRRYCSSTQMIN
ncbi:Transmembrane protein 41A [Blomia tropicalis]|nr:Transmembrane protein 41A [Blomia tropicalis]